MNRIEITNPFLGLCYMQVCAESNATDEEILEVCNRENPAGTSGGWQEVVREESELYTKDMLPGPCAEFPRRTHFLVAC